MPHQIRLQGPWLAQMVALDSDGLSTELAETIRLPEGWDEWVRTTLNPSRQAVLSRSFGRPTGLAEHQEVWLVIETDWTGEVWLNEGLLGQLARSASNNRFPIRKVLLARNHLRMIVDPSESSGKPARRRVYLEIDSTE